MATDMNESKVKQVDSASEHCAEPSLAETAARSVAVPLPLAKSRQKKRERLLLEAARNYTVPEAAAAVGVAAITIWRALESGHLKCYRVGRRVLCHGGEHLIPWLEAGGKTSKG